MKSKKIFLLPASMLLMTACSGSANTSIPKEYKPVDVTNTVQRESFFAKVADNIGTTYEKAAEGFNISGAFSFREISFTNKNKDGSKINSYFKVTDFSFDYSIALVGLSEGSDKAKAAITIDNLGFKFEAKDDEKEKVYSLKASDLDVALYIEEGNAYLDSSDKDIKTFVYAAIDLEAEMDGEVKADEVKTTKEKAGKYLGKYKFTGEVKKDAEDVPTKLTSAEVLKIQSVISGAFGTVTTNEKTRDMITLANDENSKGCAVGFGLTSEGASDLLEKKDSLVGDLAASLVFDKEGLFTRFGFAGNANYKSVDEDDDENIEINISKLNFSGSMKYGAKSVKLPSFSDYVEFTK